MALVELKPSVDHPPSGPADKLEDAHKRWQRTVSKLDRLCQDHAALTGSLDPLILARYVLHTASPTEQATAQRELTSHPVLAELCRIVGTVLTETNHCQC